MVSLTLLGSSGVVFSQMKLTSAIAWPELSWCTSFTVPNEPVPNVHTSFKSSNVYACLSSPDFVIVSKWSELASPIALSFFSLCAELGESGDWGVFSEKTLIGNNFLSRTKSF